MIIAVASGKGGTGKTLVAISLALSLKGRTNVQLLDCDVEEPNAHLLLHPTVIGRRAVSIPVLEVDRERCNYYGKCAEVCVYHAIAVVPKYVLTFPELCHSCGACSYLCPEGAISEVEREIGVRRGRIRRDKACPGQTQRRRAAGTAGDQKGEAACQSGRCGDCGCLAGDIVPCGGGGEG